MAGPRAVTDGQAPGIGAITSAAERNGHDQHTHAGALLIPSSSEHAEADLQPKELKRVSSADVDAKENESLQAPLWNPSESLTQDQEQLPSATIIDPTPPSSIEEVKTQMLTARWCLHQIEYLAQRHSLLVLRKFAKLDRRRPRPEDHRHCLEQSHCIAYDAPNNGHHHYRHAVNCPGRTCSKVEVPYKKLVQIVKSGGVPYCPSTIVQPVVCHFESIDVNSVPIMRPSVMFGPTSSQAKPRMLFPHAKSDIFSHC